MYSAEYELNVDGEQSIINHQASARVTDHFRFINLSSESPMSLEKLPPKVEHAEVRSTVVLRCNSDLYPATFHWSKEQGTLSAEQDISSVRIAKLFKIS